MRPEIVLSSLSRRRQGITSSLAFDAQFMLQTQQSRLDPVLMSDAKAVWSRISFKSNLVQKRQQATFFTATCVW